MTDRPPRSGDDALGQALGVTGGTAGQVRRSLGEPSAEFVEFDDRLRAEAAVADLDAARSLNMADIEAAAQGDDPQHDLQRTVEERSDARLRARLAAHASWGKTEDRAARTLPAREAMDAKFLAEAGGDRVRAEHLRKAYYLRLALKSAQARRSRREDQ